MKILTITGTRPELIRLSVIMRKLDGLCQHIHVYTNQNYDSNLSTIFLKDLEIRNPDYYFNKTNGIGEFLGNGFIEFDKILQNEKPDKVLVLGDTNSGLLSILASKCGIPVYHMEAGNRCYDGEVPEETNRRVIDSCSLFNLPYTENSKQNLINERYHKNYVFKTGNPIAEVLSYYADKISKSQIIQRLNNINKFALLSFHRTENVDSKEVSKNVMEALSDFDMPVIFPLHPRTRDQFKKNGIEIPYNILIIDPIGFFDFVHLEQKAQIVITDSGTVPEETSLFGVPCVVLRNTTERQELMENGSLILAGTKKDDIIRALNSVTKMNQQWGGLDDYDKTNVSDTVIRILLGQNVSFTRKGHDEY